MIQDDPSQMTQDAPQGTAPPGSAPVAPAPQQQQASQPTPQQAETAHHALLGKFVKSIMGTTVDYQIDPKTGQTVAVPQQRTPGQWGKSMVLGAMLGMAGAGNSSKGASGGFLGGFARGGVASNQYEQQQDAQKRAQAQEQYKNQMEAQRNKREQDEAGRQAEAFKTEQQHRTALIAHENIETVRTQQLIKGETLVQYQREAENGQVKVQSYKDSGIEPIARDKTWQEIQTINAANPKSTSWDWEQTGVKTVINKDGTTGYVPTFEAYDPTKSVKVSQDFINLMKKAKIDELYPGTTERIKAGQELKPVEFSALKGQYQKAVNDQLQREKDGLSIAKTKAEINDYNAQALERSRNAARSDKAEKQSQLLADGLDEWNKTYDNMQKKDPNTSHQDAFNKLSPKAQFSISTNLVKTMDSLERQIKDSLSQFPPDQARADELKEQQESYRAMQREAVGASVKADIPKAPKKGSPAPLDVVQKAVDRSGGDPDKANKLLMELGYADTTKPAASPDSEDDNYIIKGAKKWLGGVESDYSTAKTIIRGAKAAAQEQPSRPPL